MSARYQAGWSVFRVGPRYGEVFPDEQFPVEAIDELHKQMIPDINAQLPTMLMQDRNSDQLADLILAWIDEHVE